MKKRLAGILMGIILAATALTACGSKAEGSAQTYVKGVLDVAYNKGTEDYVKATGAKEEDAKKFMAQSVEAEAKIMAAYFGMEEPSAEVIEALKPAVEKMYENVSYTVEASGDKVKVSHKEIYMGASEELQQYIDDFNVKAYIDGDTSCTDEAFAKGIADIILKGTAEDFCGTETKSVELTVTEKDGKYTVSDEDLVALDESMIVYP